MTADDPQVPSSSDLDPTARPKSSARFRLRNYFLTGLIVAGPLTITMYITWWFITWVDGWVKPLVPERYLPETYLPFPIPGLRARDRTRRADDPRLPHGQSRRQDAHQARRGGAEPDAGGAGNLQGHEADLRDDLLRQRHLLPYRRPGRISGARHVVARLHLDACRPRSRGAASGGRRVCGRVPALHAQPDHRVFLLSAAQERHRTRHERRRRRKARHVGRRHPVRPDPGAATDARRSRPRQRTGHPREGARAGRKSGPARPRLSPRAGASLRRRARTGTAGS